MSPARSLAKVILLAISGFAVVVVAITLGLVAIVSQQTTREALLVTAGDRLAAVAAERSQAIAAWFAGVEADVAALSLSQTTRTALQRLSAAYGPVADQLKSAYIDRNPNPIGSRHLLDRAEGEAAYHSAHATFHPEFRDILTRKEYYDVFLFDRSGNLVYTVFKEQDFATDFANGPYAGTGLGTAFRRALEAEPGTVVVSDFENYAPSAGAPAAFIAAPIPDTSGRVIGVLAVQLPVDQLRRIAGSPTSLQETGDAYVVGPDGRSRNASRFDDRFQLFETVIGPDRLAQMTSVAEFRDYRGTGQDGHEVVQIATRVQGLDLGWIFVVEQDLDELLTPLVLLQQKLASTALLIVVPIAIAVSCAGGLILARRIVRPLLLSRDVVERIAGGDYVSAVPLVDRRDEIGAIAAALDVLRGKLGVAAAEEARAAEHAAEQRRVVAALSEALSDLAAGRLDRQIETPFAGDYDAIRIDLNRAIGKLSTSLARVIDSSASIRGGIGEIAAGAEDLARRTEQQAATLEETSAAFESIDTRVRQSAETANEMIALADRARASVEASGAAVTDAVNSMATVETLAREVTSIVSTIKSLAFQTNLLALNAGVESARAGEAGRGFAVVASEVRALAQRSADAAQEITRLVDTTKSSIDTGVSLVRRAGESLGDIVGQVGTISDLVRQSAGSMKEQSSTISEIGKALTELDRVTQLNAAISEQTSAASNSLDGEAAGLVDLVGAFRIGRTPAATESRRPALHAA